MKGVNGRRLVAGGLLAGLVLNVAHVVAEVATKSESERMITRLGLPQVGEAAMITIVLAGFVIGLVAVWIYAAIRPRYGAGAGTALRAALAVWVLACLFPNSALLAYGIFTPSLAWISTATDLVIVPLGTLAGAWLYREDETSAVASPVGAARAHA